MHQPSRQPERSQTPLPPPPPAQATPITVYVHSLNPISEAYAAFVHGYAAAGRRVAESAAESLARIGRNLR
jgi:hypothetical protein